MDITTVPIFPGNQTFADVPFPDVPDLKLPDSYHIQCVDHTLLYPLGTSAKRFNTLQIIPEKTDGSDNTGDVQIWIYDKDASDFALAETLTADSQPFNWNPPAGYSYGASDFKIKAVNNGDGVKVIYS